MSLEGKADSLEERIKSHARAFDGLLSIIPAKEYYNEDMSSQWQRKKQSKAEARAAKKAKLDPDNHKSAKDVLDEKAAVAARKRKIAEAKDDGDEGSLVLEGIVPEKPLHDDGEHPIQSKRQKTSKEQDIASAPQSTKDQAKEAEDEESHHRSIAEKKRAKRALKKEKAEKQAAADKAKRARRMAKRTAIDSETKDVSVRDETSHQLIDPLQDDGAEVNLQSIEIDLGQGLGENSHSGSSESSTPQSPIFSGSANLSGSSSISSIPPGEAEKPENQPHSSNNPPATQLDPVLDSQDDRTELTTQGEHADTTGKQKIVKSSSTPHKDPANAAELKRRLQERIDALRTARKAPGVEGAQAQSRQELLESRRQKGEQRKAHKKELRRKAKEEEARQKAESLAQGSPLMSPGSPQTPLSEASGDLLFGRVDFGAGQRATSNLQGVLQSKLKAKGPSDPATALQAAEKQQARLAGLDEDKRADIAEKDAWLNARKRAQGERIRDNTSLLKKTLQRKQQQKKKGEKEWTARIDGVKKGQDIRQKKREANIQKRKDEKGAKKAKKSSGGSKSKKLRPGFEGSFRAKPAKPRRR